MPKVLRHGKDKLVVRQEVRPNRHVVLHQLADELHDALGRRGLEPEPPEWVAGHSAWKVPLPFADIRLTSFPGRKVVVEGHAHARPLVMQPQRTQHSLDLAMAAVGVLKWAEAAKDVYLARKTLQADIVGWPIAFGIQDRFVCRSRAPFDPEVGGRGKLESFTIGNMQVYGKTLELIKNPDKAYVKSIWLASGLWDGWSPVTRPEFTTVTRDFRRLGTTDDAVLWQDCLDRWNLRRKVAPHWHLPYRRCPEDKLWRQLRALDWTDACAELPYDVLLGAELPGEPHARGHALYGFAALAVLRNLSAESALKASPGLPDLLGMRPQKVEAELGRRIAEYRARVGACLPSEEVHVPS